MLKDMKYQEIPPTTLLAPLPCALVTSRDSDGKPNIFTAAWTGIVNTKPPMVSLSVKPSRFSYHIIRESGFFCLHPADKAHVRALDYCGVVSGREHDKFKETGLKEMDIGMPCPALDGLPVCLGCEVRSVTALGSHDLILGEIIKVFVRQDLMDDKGGIHLEKGGLVSYSHGLYQELGAVLGFFGFSVAREETRKRRMRAFSTAGNG